VGRPLAGGGAALVERCTGTAAEGGSSRTRQAEPGDLARFARGTVGIVLDVEDGGRVKFAYVRRGSVIEGVVSPERPHVRRGKDGRVANTFLVPIRPGEPRRAPRLAAELLRGFAAPPPPERLAAARPRR
jgi:hypothetical protein